MKTKKLFFHNSKKQKLAGILYSSNIQSKSFPIVIYSHGYRSTKENKKAKAIAEILTEKNINVLSFDFSGRGESDGKFEDTTITNYLDDLNSAIKFISKKTNKIFLIGNSLGGLVTLQVASKLSNNKKIKKIVLLSPVSKFPWRKTKEYSKKAIVEWKKKGYTYTYSERYGDMKINYSFYLDVKKYNKTNLYSSITQKTLIIHGDKDKSVNIKDSVFLSKILKQNILVKLKDADHNYANPLDFDKVIKTTTAFLNEDK